MLPYCPLNTSQPWDKWHDHGVSDCLLETVCTAAPAGLLLLLGIGELIFYRRHGTALEHYSRPQSALFRLQVATTVVLALLAPARLLAQWLLLPAGQPLAGFQVLVCVLTALSWFGSLRLIWLERNNLLPAVPVRGHGIPLLLYWAAALLGQAVELINFRSPHWWFRLDSNIDWVEVSLYGVRLAGGVLVFLIGLRAPGIASVADYIPCQRPAAGTDGVNNPRSTGAEGTIGAQEGSTWRGLARKLRRLLPFIWPRSDPLLQATVLFCLALLVGTRITNVYVPLYYKYIVDDLTTTDGIHLTPQFPWKDILTYVGLKFLQGGGVGSMGLLNNLRNLLWIKVQQYTEREVQVDLFAHLHRLSLRWHLARKTGEVLRIMDRGTSSINMLLSYLVFQILPTVADIVIAISFFAGAFNFWFGLIVFVTMLLYMVATAVITEWRTKYRRQSNLLDNAQRTKGVDALLNYETVKYYDAEEYEINRYRTSILDRQRIDWLSQASLNVLNVVQNVVINGGLLAGSLYCAYLVSSDGSLTVGDYVLFSTYILQLYTPLNWFGTYYRMIQQNFVDMENMLDLLREEEEVIDLPGVSDLVVKEGRLEFRNVSFHYVVEKPILRGVSFSVEPGQTVALVGPSGGGKSTLIRLLFRFFDVTDGRIMLDNQDIKWVKQRSVRRAIGVVPQDTVLFNETIRYNIRYARLSASDEEVESAARAADMHDKIMTFPDKYETQVGERGLKLSGGEKQRVAIARTLLKAPRFILLDEATSALDTQTERNIQESLSHVATGRTTLVVAHRLSTIVHADQILVLKDGRIVERGRHEELLERGAVYAAMWRQQSETTERRGRRSPERKPREGAAAATGATGTNSGTEQ
ncbi:ATP-binding cassette sub-family B member 6-like [Amphibalanus amphitrite]|uniref:ATP-binding cassette sub-family B member 6-like n=1 Tax=Amphibalanus amphitrite TaxID=1232801 RepID=UPI001C92A542|nr:ATP-binding cassette sub-family B member 6-like [Amphibalanus amphitrite]XP_043219998.1 ATP-binding cassette sub-family B member 6-like [Amphibalanus amphitrite]XP_043220006.1 ATP-binding cassette sub-family B member 6-like [Amphibalanus amphitrite]XP_043220015.1 ATP-binding cassette sub-family B member 6-like [Amphibalanus amphitrite]